MTPKTASAAHRRRLNPDERRRELLEAAVRVLRRNGPADCQVQDITTEAGTAKGNFYRYFLTWEDLLAAVRDHVMDEYADDLRRRVADRGVVDWWNALEEEVDVFLDFQLGLEGLHHVAFHGPASRARPIEPERRAISLIGAFLCGGVRAAAFANVDIGPTAAPLFAVLHGVADALAAGTDRDEFRNAALHVTRQLPPPGT